MCTVATTTFYTTLYGTDFCGVIFVFRTLKVSKVSQVIDGQGNVGEKVIPVYIGEGKSDECLGGGAEKIRWGGEKMSVSGERVSVRVMN